MVPVPIIQHEDYDNGGQWYAYRSWINPGTPYQGPPFPQGPWYNERKPVGGFAPGTKVQVVMWVQSTTTVCAWFAGGGKYAGFVDEDAWDWMVGLNPSATTGGNLFRKTTSMVVSGKAFSRGNRWETLQLRTTPNTWVDWVEAYCARWQPPPEPGQPPEEPIPVFFGDIGWVLTTSPTVNPVSETVDICYPGLTAAAQKVEK